MNSFGPYQLSFSNSFGQEVVPREHFLPVFQRGLAVLEQQVPQKAKIAPGTLELTLVDDTVMQTLNARERGKNEPTDVLSLSYEEIPGVGAEGNLVGEIFLSVDTARRQAKEHKKTLEGELLFLFAHGLLHVFGYDHQEEAQRKEMFDLQDEILGTHEFRAIADAQAAGEAG